jgi:hypothetical protein
VFGAINPSFAQEIHNVLHGWSDCIDDSTAIEALVPPRHHWTKVQCTGSLHFDK